MFTAKDMHKMIKETEDCPNIGYWLENSLAAQFMVKSFATVASSILRVNKWSHKGFLKAMEERGFSVQLFNDQRDGDFYTVKYPPQER